MNYTAPSLWRMSQQMYHLPSPHAQRGIICTYSVVRQPSWIFRNSSPYIVALVKLDSGQCLLGQIVDCSLEKITIGLAVKPILRKLFVPDDQSMIVYGIKFKPC